MQEAVRLYLRELRDKQGVTQQDAADNIGLSLRAFSDWETGKSDDIKSRFLIRLVQMINASWEDISYLELNSVRPEEGLLYAERKNHDTTKETNAEHKALIEQLKVDDELARAFIIFWSGWKAKELSQSIIRLIGVPRGETARTFGS